MNFKELSFPKKIEYIWEYYKIHIISVISVVALGIWLVNRLVLNPPPEVCMGIAIYGPYVQTDKIAELNNYLNEKLIPPDVNETIETVNFFFTEDTEAEDVVQDADMKNKFYTYLYSMQLDLLILNEEEFKSCIKAEFLTPVTDFLSADTVGELEDNGKLLYDSVTDGGEQLPYGISVADSAVFKDLGILDDDAYYIGFVPIDGKEEKTAQAALELIKE